MFSLAFLECFTLVLAIGHLISPLVFIEVKVIQFLVFSHMTVNFLGLFFSDRQNIFWSDKIFMSVSPNDWQLLSKFREVCNISFITSSIFDILFELIIFFVIEWVTDAYCQVSYFSAISWREQVKIRWNVVDVRFVVRPTRLVECLQCYLTETTVRG
jgi:hypothetical protein